MTNDRCWRHVARPALDPIDSPAAQTSLRSACGPLQSSTTGPKISRIWTWEAAYDPAVVLDSDYIVLMPRRF